MIKNEITDLITLFHELKFIAKMPELIFLTEKQDSKVVLT